MPQWLSNWFERHQHPASLTLHLIGIPLTLAAVAVAAVQLWQWRWDLWWRPVALLVAGYLLQWIGHRIEGNDMGELILLKKWLGRPYIVVAPRYAPGHAENRSGRPPTRPERDGGNTRDSQP